MHQTKMHQPLSSDRRWGLGRRSDFRMGFSFVPSPRIPADGTEVSPGQRGSRHAGGQIVRPVTLVQLLNMHKAHTITTAPDVGTPLLKLMGRYGDSPEFCSTLNTRYLRCNSSLYETTDYIIRKK